MPTISIIVALFVILNPIGNVPIFIGLLKNYDQKRQQKIIVRELFFALLIMLIFGFGGEEVLSLLNLNISVLRIGGGIILALIALDMMFPKPFIPGEALRQEPFIVPLAIPIIAGPGTISNVMIFSLQMQNHWLMLVCIILAWLPSLIILLMSSFLQKMFGEKILHAFERFAGMVLMFIAVQMITTGVYEFIEGTVKLPIPLASHRGEPIASCSSSMAFTTDSSQATLSSPRSLARSTVSLAIPSIYSLK